jgi:hypothetical protein
LARALLSLAAMRHLLFAMLAVVTLVGGCFIGHGHEPPPIPPLEIDAAISAVSLGDECADEDEPSGAPRVAGDCAEDGCGSWCQQSTVSLAITADGDRAASFRVLRATLLASDGTVMMELSTSNARLYTGGEYAEWDETIPTPSDLAVLYDLDGVDWSGVADPYARTYRVRLLVEIDGEQRTLTSEETTREYPIVT